MKDVARSGGLRGFGNLIPKRHSLRSLPGALLSFAAARLSDAYLLAWILKAFESAKGASKQQTVYT